MRGNGLSSLFVFLLAAGPTSEAHAQTPDATRLKREAFQEIDARADRLGRVSDAIFSYAEIGFQEYETAKLLTSELEKAGFRVERGVADMPTAFRATYGSGSPVIGLMADFDGVPGASQKPAVVQHEPVVPGAPGHGEGHNAGQPTIIGAAIAIRTLLEKHTMPGTVVVYGGPAEELLASRVYMVNAGLFDGVDAMLDAHIGSAFGTSWGLNNLGIVSVQWSFHGEQAHGSTPWTGRSALDAVELMNIGMNYLREHLPLEMRFHYVIRFGGDQPNVVPPEATVWYYFRHRTYDGLVALLDKARQVAQGASFMTFTTFDERILSGSWPFNGNKALAEVLQKNIETIGMPRWSNEDVAFAKTFQQAMGVKEPKGLSTTVSPLRHAQQGSSSSDVGDVSWNVPYVRMTFPSQIAGAIANHHWSAAIVPATPIAHKGIVAGAKALAGTMVDLLTDPKNLAAVRADFAKDTANVTWRSLVPPGTKPPTFLNAELAAKWKPLLEQHYYDPASARTLLEEWGIGYPPQPGPTTASGPVQ
jgi:aminobenzoyl-glutamate utilization protein B